MSSERQRTKLWRCPKCGHRFVTKNLWHSCGRYRIKDHFVGRPAGLREAFQRFVKAARRCGPVTVYAQKTRIVLQHRVRFAGVVVRKNFLDAGLWLKRRVDHPRLRKVESFGILGYGLHFRVERPGDIDRAMVQLIREAYVTHRSRFRS